MDPKTRKLMTMHLALHRRDDTDRLYVSRTAERRRISCIEDSVGAPIREFKDYIKKAKKDLLQ